MRGGWLAFEEDGDVGEIGQVSVGEGVGEKWVIGWWSNNLTRPPNSPSYAHVARLSLIPSRPQSYS
jgi:hypothetical protein